MAKGLFRCVWKCFNGLFLVVKLNIATTCQSAEKLNDLHTLFPDEFRKTEKERSLKCFACHNHVDGVPCGFIHM